MLGDGCVGKTTAVKDFVKTMYGKEYLVTLGINVYTKKVGKLNLNIRDVSGQPGFHGLHKRAIKDVSGAVCVSDMTRKYTLDNIRNFWLPKLQMYAGNVPFVILGNKSDLITELEFGEDDIKKVADEFGMPSFRTSVVKGENVETAFKSMSDLLLSKKILNFPKLPEVNEEVTPTSILDLTYTRYVDWAWRGTYDNITSSVLKAQTAKAGVDINHPTRDQMNRLLDLLIETSSKGDEERGLWRFGMLTEYNKFYEKYKF